ncbi:MAG TPA: hypothetical protein PKY77_06215 [Phycisphaerae bacterium]|nr:hypothetical protein [Phycisphaerae bacterium]HRY69550.1 hypothetical protein [Phycisphaerae bacterium]HSA28146.1 hypothetical protein [Phycisphaerae bacterium]
MFQPCLTGAGDPGGLYDQLLGVCQCLDGTGAASFPDRSVDAIDLASFVKCMTTGGQGLPADTACDN